LGKSKVFMIMPFADEYFEVYEMLKREFVEKFEFNHAADEGNQQNILKDIIKPKIKFLRKANMLLVLLATKQNFWEINKA